MIADKSYRFILPPLVIGLLLYYYNTYISIIFLSFSFYLIWFFRDPTRVIDKNPNLVYAAADGNIIYINENEDSIKIAIRMSPFNVHLNRSPIEGKVVEIIYQPGKHLNVYFGNIEKKNERNLITIQNESLLVKVLQITGMFARRIECWVEENTNISQGEKIGIIRFGSQTNMTIEFNKDKIRPKVLIANGDKVYAGLTALIRLNEENEVLNDE